MPHKKRANKNHIQVKKILAASELSLLDKKKPNKRSERVPRHDNNPADRKREEQILNDDFDDDRNKKKFELKKHINKELEQQEKSVIPKKSRRNKYFLINHPELKGMIPILPKTNKRKNESDEQNEPPKKKISEETKPSICDKLVSHMITSRFRYLNEKLYTTTSTEAQKLFEQDPQSFHAYHQGYSVSFLRSTTNIFFSFFFQTSMSRWPNQPLDEIIEYIRKRSSNLVIVDMGCGDAHLARTLKSTHPNIHSFDFVALNEHVQVCDIAHTPLKTNSVDIVIYCLSLMGTNLTDFIHEAHRILRLRGTMKIVEIASRFGNQPQKFIRKIESIGFQCSKTNSLDEKTISSSASSKYFYTFDFVKITDQIKSKSILTLAPCLHKKR
jgi:ribosomal RNA-processing protein 8